MCWCDLNLKTTIKSKYAKYDFIICMPYCEENSHCILLEKYELDSDFQFRAILV